MIKTIIRPSDALTIFFSELEHPLSKPQTQHVMRIVEGLIVGPGRKTLSQLYAHWVDAPDASAVADFLRVSPWSDDSLNQMVAEMSLSDMIERVKQDGITPLVYVSFDDSTTVKDKDTHALEGVDWQHDHNASGLGQRQVQQRHGACQLSS